MAEEQEGRKPLRSELRGGAWNNPAENLQAANRNRNDARNRNDNIGFRVAVAPRTRWRTNGARHRAGVFLGAYSMSA